MGAWGVDAFENDTAADWVFDKIVPAIRRALGKRANIETTLAALVVMLDLELGAYFNATEVEQAFDRVFEADARDRWRDPKRRKQHVLKIYRRWRHRGVSNRWSPAKAIFRKRGR